MDILQQAMAIPDIEKCRKLLCIQPHPDDNEVGAGASIAKFAKQGCKVYYLTVTDGCLGSPDPSILPSQIVKIREEEQKAAAGVLGVTEVFSLNLRDNLPLDVSEIAAGIIDVIRKVKPQMVMTVDPWLPYEGHPDHRKVGMAVVEACMFASNPKYPYIDETTCFPVWGIEGIAFYNTAYPNTFVDITGYMDTKLAAMSQHKSQFFGETLALYSMYFPAKARQLAQGRGFEMAEGFKVLSPLHLHCFVDAIHV